jgi:hypothetical protein
MKLSPRSFTMILVVCGLLPTLAISAGDRPTLETANPPLHSLRPEFPQDPPAPAAQPVPGAGPARKVCFGRFTNVQVNVGPGGSNIPGDAANETTIAVDPTNPQRMVIGWRQFDTVLSSARKAGWGYTTDGGRNWTFPGVITPGTYRSDPVVCADASGTFYYNSLEGDFTTDVVKSTDGGVTWGPPVFAYGGDKEWMTVDRTHGIGRGNLYSFWTGSGGIFTRSTNGGQSFTTPTGIPSSPHWGTMDVAPDGVLYIAGISNSGSVFLVSKSSNAQDPLMSATTFTTVNVNLGGSLSAADGPNPEGLLGQPWIAVDPSSGATAGYIYLVCSVDPPGADPLDVHFTRSTDGGSTWSAPVRINDDPGTAAWQWFATMSVAPTGRIDVVWNDTRNTGQVNLSELHYSFSSDEGATWSANEQLSPAWDSFVGWPNQSKIGDYYQMTSDRVGANLAWAATFGGEENVYYLRIGDYDCNDNGVGDSLDISQGTSPDTNENGIPDECEGLVSEVADQGAAPGRLGNAPNPFTGSTSIRFDLGGTGGRALLRIFDVGGRIVRTLVDAELEGGPHTLAWNGTDDQGRPLPAGTYLYRLEAPGAVRAQRMLLLR